MYACIIMYVPITHMSIICTCLQTQNRHLAPGKYDLKTLTDDWNSESLTHNYSNSDITSKITCVFDERELNY